MVRLLQKAERAFGFELLWLCAWTQQQQNSPKPKNHKEPGDLLETGQGRKKKKNTDKQKLDFQNSLSDIQQRGTSQQDALRESIFTDSRPRVQKGGRSVQATVRPGPS